MRTVGFLMAVTGLLGTACAGNVFDLELGTCFDDVEESATATEFSDVPIVDCSEPHDNEVYATFELPGTEFPGPDAAEEAAFDGCLERFDAFVGKAWEESELDFTYLYPTTASWASGDREIVCAVYRLDAEQTTGSLEGAGI